MANKKITSTGEKPVSKAKDEVIKEAQRIEEACLYSSKGHFSAAGTWGALHLIIGIPSIIASALAGLSIFSQANGSSSIAVVLSILAAILSGLTTFLNPNGKAGTHLSAGNSYDSLQNKVRIFWSIECRREKSEEVLTVKLNYFSEQKDKLNQSFPQIPWLSYQLAKWGIKHGEGKYEVDTSKPIAD